MRKRLIIVLAISLVLAIVILNIKIYKIETNSMKEHIQPKDYVLVTKNKLFNLDNKNDQILSFKNNYENDNNIYVKRVYAIENDTIFIQPTHIKVNNKKIPHDPIFMNISMNSNSKDSSFNESVNIYSRYILSRSKKIIDTKKYILENENAIIVPKNHLFMVGDNYYESMDSRFWGLIPKVNIKGVVRLVL